MYNYFIRMLNIIFTIISPLCGSLYLISVFYQNDAAMRLKKTKGA